jgi:hypothetical protein
MKRSRSKLCLSTARRKRFDPRFFFGFLRFIRNTTHLAPSLVFAPLGCSSESCRRLAPSFIFGPLRFFSNMETETNRSKLSLRTAWLFLRVASTHRSNLPLERLVFSRVTSRTTRSKSCLRTAWFWRKSHGTHSLQALSSDCSALHVSRVNDSLQALMRDRCSPVCLLACFVPLTGSSLCQSFLSDTFFLFLPFWVGLWTSWWTYLTVGSSAATTLLGSVEYH